MLRNANARGRTDLKPAHNALFSIMGSNGERASSLGGAGRYHPPVHG